MVSIEPLVVTLGALKENTWKVICKNVQKSMIIVERYLKLIGYQRGVIPIKWFEDAVQGRWKGKIAWNIVRCDNFYKTDCKIVIRGITFSMIQSFVNLRA